VEVASVEFYHNDQLINTIVNSPYKTEWQIDGSGIQSFYMIAYDAAGNSARSDTVRITTP
jgi:hypothetical protein